MRKSEAKIRVSDQSLLVHFEKVGRRAKFEQICQRWQMVFPQSVWSEKYRAWELPIANFDDVKHFCDKMFWRVRVESLESSIEYHQQLSLGF